MDAGPYSVAFVHPDLGIGGAERLVVDAALGLAARGHSVRVYTSHRDPQHCFREAADGTLRVTVFGDFLPRALLGALHALFAYLRSAALCLYVLLDTKLGAGGPVDVFFVDQVSAGIPLLKFTSAKIFFYCHFPDKYLATGSSLARRIYRLPFDYVEELTTGLADEILVNSFFTASVFREAFPRIKTAPRVLCPGINVAAYDKPVDDRDPAVQPFKTDAKFILSINRFERKKNIALAISAFHFLKEKNNKLFSKSRLIIAGGYDKRVAENVEHLRELQELATALGLTHTTYMPNRDAENLLLSRDTKIAFVPSFTDSQRTFFLSHASALLYTPSNEHFGIVPLEAMYARVPVIAVDSGGPRETVADGSSGFLCPGEPEAFGRALIALLADEPRRALMGLHGRAVVEKRFTLAAFTDALEARIRALVAQHAFCTGRGRWFKAILVFCMALVALQAWAFLSRH